MFVGVSFYQSHFLLVEMSKLGGLGYVWILMKKGFFGTKNVGLIAESDFLHKIEKGLIRPDTLVCSTTKTHGHWIDLREIRKPHLSFGTRPTRLTRKRFQSPPPTSDKSPLHLPLRGLSTHGEGVTGD